MPLTMARVSASLRPSFFSSAWNFDLAAAELILLDRRQALGDLRVGDVDAELVGLELARLLQHEQPDRLRLDLLVLRRALLRELLLLRRHARAGAVHLVDEARLRDVQLPDRRDVVVARLGCAAAATAARGEHSEEEQKREEVAGLHATSIRTHER